MEHITYKINGQEHSIVVDGSPERKLGENEILSNEKFDITYNQPWYQNGYTETDFLSTSEFTNLREGLILSISKIMQEELSIDTKGFNLENYHNYVNSNEDHFKIVSRTRDLFADDFNFPVMELIPRLGKILGFNLTNLDKRINEELHIIVRINRPNSNDFNPPHKDIYEGVDNSDHIPQFVNFWIPIAGVTENSSLPLAPKSHLINENAVLRTFGGGVVAGNKYRVRMIESWNGNNDLVRSKVKDGQALIFSGHLIHGLAINKEPGLTRIALEFRLFKKD